MTEHKRLHRIIHATRSTIAEALVTVSDWLLDAAYWAGPQVRNTPMRYLHDLTVCEMLDDLCLIDAERRENAGDAEYVQALDIQERHIHATLSQLADKA